MLVALVDLPAPSSRRMPAIPLAIARPFMEDVVPLTTAGTGMGTVISGFDATTASDEDMASLKRSVYSEKILILKDQHLSPAEYVALGRRLGQVERYYQP